MKIIRWAQENILFIVSLFLLAFIPLYPKLPLITVTHTFVYIRADDFFVALAFVLYFIQLIRKKVTINSPLTIPIIVYWLVGLIATILGTLFIFPHLQGLFPKIAFLFWLRHIEYIGLFFIAFTSIKEKKYLPYIISVLVITLTVVVLYGIGQRFIPSFFPAFSTMNEEFAKGIPLTLSALGRIQSTFAGHYDLAAYLVMLIPIIGSLVFGIRKWWMKLGLIFLSILSLMVLLMTASRTSFAMYLLATVFMLIIQKQKKWILPVIILSLVLLRSFTGIYSRYAATFAPVNVIVDARTGKAIGIASNSGDSLVVNGEQSTGENLPKGSQYLTSNNNVGTATNVSIRSQKGASKSITIQNLQGDFIVKKAQALDISITTRLQAEWPNAIQAFRRDLLFGSGYSSISLATDGNYFRILGETGLLGFISFLFIFLMYGIYTVRVLPEVDSPLARSLVLGMSAGIFGLALNALLIDVFESSKVAYTLWLLLGFSIGILHLYQGKLKIDYRKEIKAFFLSTPVLLSSLVITGILVFYQMFDNFFVGDDFTWLRWIADCQKRVNDAARCLPFPTRVTQFFLHSSDFFYRPMEKVYFLFMYGNSPDGNSLGGLNPVLYHVTSLFAHIALTVALFFILMRLMKRKLFAFIGAFLFLVLAGHAESLYWISASGHVFASMFIVWGLLTYIWWKETKNILLLILSGVLVFLAPFFQEYGVIGILLILGYQMISSDGKINWKHALTKLNLIVYGLPLFVYFLLKIISGSFWTAGDYKYNILKLPLNIVGNYVGALGLSLFGTPFMSFYTMLRDAIKHQLLLASLAVIIIFVFSYFIYELRKELSGHDKRMLLFSSLFFIVPFLPFAGFGNIAPRYIYLSSFGVVIFFVFLLEKFLDMLKKSIGMSGAVICTAVLVLLSCFYQIGTVRQSNIAWHRAGMITENFILYLNDQYESLFPIKHQVFYFANIPIVTGEAWVFPVGLPDAVWFDYRQKNPEVFQVQTLIDAKQKAAQNPSAVIFNFDKSGSISLQRFP